MLKRLQPLRPYLARYKVQFVLGLAALGITQAVGVTVPLVIKAAIDSIAQGTTPRRLLYFAALLLGIALAKAFFQFWMRWILIGISRDIEYDLRNDLFRHLMRLSQHYYTETRTGDLMSKLTNDLNAVRTLVGPGIMYSANTLVTGALTVALMIHLDWRLTLLTMAPLPFASIAVKIFGQQIHSRFEKIQAMYSVLTEKVRENLSGVRVVRAFVQEKPEEALFNRMNQEFVERNKGLIWITSFLWPVLGFLFMISMLLIMIVGGHHVITGVITVGTFVAFNVYLFMLFFPIIALGFVTNLVQRGLASLGRLWQIFDARPEIDDRDVPANPVKELQGGIEFRNLRFSYNGTQILKNVNLQIPAGKTVAIVGATGSGKTTLVNLVPRLYDAPPGSVLIDGVPIRQIPLAVLRRNIGFVPQETFLFSQTVRENIKFGTPDALEADTERAADISS